MSGGSGGRKAIVGIVCGQHHAAIVVSFTLCVLYSLVLNETKKFHRAEKILEGGQG
jgi:hypothetical protein